MCAAGSTAQAAEKLEEYHAAGVRVPVLNPLGPTKMATIAALGKAFS